MSDDSIKRQDAIDAIEELISARREWLSANARDEIKGLDAAMCEIQNLPTADVPDREVGKWNGVYVRCEKTILAPPSVRAIELPCDGCKFVGTKDTEFPCSVCIRREKDYYEQVR